MPITESHTSVQPTCEKCKKTSSKKKPADKQAAAKSAVAKARAAIIASRRATAPPRTGGFFGSWNRPGGLGPELKTIDVSTTTISPVAVAGATVLLNGVAQGSDYTNRIGRKVLLKSMLFRANMYPVLNTASPIGNTIRLLLVYDSQTNGALAAVADVLNAATYLQPTNLNNRDRFRILLDN